MTEHTTPREVATIQGVEVVFSRRTRTEVGLEVLRFLDQQSQRIDNPVILDLPSLLPFETVRMSRSVPQMA